MEAAGACLWRQNSGGQEKTTSCAKHEVAKVQGGGAPKRSGQATVRGEAARQTQNMDAVPIFKTGARAICSIRRRYGGVFRLGCGALFDLAAEDQPHPVEREQMRGDHCEIAVLVPFNDRRIRERLELLLIDHCLLYTSPSPRD